MRRKKKAASRLMWLLLVITLLVLTGAYCFTPEQAAKKCIAQNAAGSMIQYTHLNEGPFRQYRLCVNHRQMMLVECTFSPFGGWSAHNALAFERNAAPVERAMLNVRRGGDDRVIYVFGGVNDGRIARLTILGRFTGDVEDFDMEVDLPWYGMAVYPDTTYFIKKVTDFYDPPREKTEPNRSIVYPTEYQIVTYDEAGNVMDTLPIDKSAWVN